MSQDAPDIILEAFQEATLRRECLQWAVSTAKNGEHHLCVVARAEAYFAFVRRPLERDRVGLRQAQAAAISERDASNTPLN